MSYFLNIIIMFILSVLTISFFPYVTIANTAPVLPLVFICALSYFRKGFEPVIIAALSGLFLDIFSGYRFGFYIIFFLLVSVVIRAIFHEGLNNISLMRFMLINLLAFFILFTLQVIELFVTGHRQDLLSLFLPFLYFIITNMFWAFLVYIGINGYFDKLKELEINRRRV